MSSRPPASRPARTGRARPRDPCARHDARLRAGRRRSGARRRACRAGSVRCVPGRPPRTTTAARSPRTRRPWCRPGGTPPSRRRWNGGPPRCCCTTRSAPSTARAFAPAPYGPTRTPARSTSAYGPTGRSGTKLVSERLQHSNSKSSTAPERCPGRTGRDSISEGAPRNRRSGRCAGPDRAGPDRACLRPAPPTGFGDRPAALRCVRTEHTARAGSPDRPRRAGEAA